MQKQGFESKRALAHALAPHLGIQADSAERQLARWTNSPTLMSLDQRSSTALAAVLGETPPGADAAVALLLSLEKLRGEVAEIRGELSDLQATVGRLEEQRSRQSTP